MSTEALNLLAVAFRVNRENMRAFQQRLDRLAEVGRELKAGQCSADTALAHAECLGFITPLEGEAEDEA